MSNTTNKKSIDLLPVPLGSVKYGASKKVTVTSSAQLIVSANEAAIGVVVRVLSLDSGVGFGSSDITIDSGTKPPAHFLSAANQGLILNITDSIYALCQSGSASLAVTVLLLPGDDI
jgi:hypothetical protein